MTILITGASGFLGSYLVEKLVDAGQDILCTKFDITKRENFDSLPNSIDTVVHLAARVPKVSMPALMRDCIEVNGLGTNNIIGWCLGRGVKKVIYASTQMMYGTPQYLPVDEEHPVLPQGHYSGYSISKYLGELFCERARVDFQLNCISLRFSRIYGYGENPGFVLTKFIDLARSEKTLTVYGEGKSKRDLLYVKDAVNAIMLALDSPYQGIYNIGSGQIVSMIELAQTVSKVFSGSMSSVLCSSTGSGSEADFYLDIRKAQRDLGFVPQYSLESGLADYRKEVLNHV